MARRLHIYRSPSFSGAEAYALEVARHHSLSHDVVFLAKSDSPLAKRIGEQKPNPSGSDRFHLETDISKIDFSNFDLIVLHSTQELKSLWPRILVAKIKGRWSGAGSPPHIVLYSHIWISHSKKDPLHAMAYSVVDSVFCASTPSKAALEKFLPLSPRKIKVVRYGRNTAKFIAGLKPKVEARRQLEVPLDATVIGTIARVDEGKGSQELFDAMIALFESSTESLSPAGGLYFLMIGPPTDGDPKATILDQTLNQKIEKLPVNIRSRIKKLGRVESASDLLKAFDLFVLATYKENFALTVLEALCAEVPCVATNSGGTPDVVVPGETGWLFEPRSSQALIASLTEALKQKTNWPKLGLNGREKVVAEYDFDVAMRELEAAITSSL